MKNVLFFVFAAVSMGALMGCSSNKVAAPEQPMAAEEMSSSPMHHDYKGEKEAPVVKKAKKSKKVKK